MRAPVRINQTVHAEVTIMQILAMITTIVIHGLPIVSLALIDCMIAPFPNKTTAEEIAGSEEFKVVFQITRAVSHRMAVFTEQKGLVRFRCKIFLDFLPRQIHTAIEIQI